MKDDGIRRYMEYDSVQDIKGIRCPVFALNGERDTQVSAKDHLGIFKRNISVDVKAKIKSYPELNHMFPKNCFELNTSISSICSATPINFTGI